MKVRCFTQFPKKIIVSAITFALARSSVMATITIQNPSFETPNIADGTAEVATAAGGLYSFGGWNGGTAYLLDNAGNAWFNQAVPDGQQALSIGTQYFLQPLNDSVSGAVTTSATEQQFNISFFAGRRKENTTTGIFSVLLQAYDSGGTYKGDLAFQKFNTGGDDSDPTTIDLGLGIGNWTNSPISALLTAPAGLLGGNNIYLVFAQNDPYGTNPGTGEAAIDKVSVTAVPEPSVALLGGVGMLTLLRRRRR